MPRHLQEGRGTAASAECGGACWITGPSKGSACFPPHRTAGRWSPPKGVTSPACTGDTASTPPRRNRFPHRSPAPGTISAVIVAVPRRGNPDAPKGETNIDTGLDRSPPTRTRLPATRYDALRLPHMLATLQPKPRPSDRYRQAAAGRETNPPPCMMQAGRTPRYRRPFRRVIGRRSRQPALCDRTPRASNTALLCPSVPVSRASASTRCPETRQHAAGRHTVPGFHRLRFRHGVHPVESSTLPSARWLPGAASIGRVPRSPTTGTFRSW